MFVYMPKEKASKAYKFAHPFHGPFCAMDGVVIQPVDRPQDEGICLAFNRVRRCPTGVPEGVS